MSGASLPPEAPPQLRISRERYHAMIRGGLLTEDDRIELIDGYLLKKMSISPGHSGTVNRLMTLLAARLGGRAIVAVQNPVAIHEFSEPEPDLVVARFREDYYAGSHPGPADIHLVIEVADSSLAFDRATKIPLYASCGIAACWLVDLDEPSLTAFSDPDGAGYRSEERFQAGGTLEIPGFPGESLELRELGW